MKWSRVEMYVKSVGRLLGIRTNDPKIKLDYWKTEKIYTYPNEQIKQVLFEVEKRKIRALEHIYKLQNR